MFFVNVQSCSVHNACYLWIRCSLSNHVFCQLCRHFRVDIFSWFSSLALPSLLESTPLSHCPASPPAEKLQPGRRHLLTAPKIPVLWFRSLGLLCSTDSHISTYAFWHDSLLPVSRLLLTIRPHLRATHCPVRAIVDSQHRHASSPST